MDELLNALESGNHLPIDSYCGDATTDPEPKTEINVWGPQVPPGTGGGTDGGGDTDSPFGSTDDTKSPTGYRTTKLTTLSVRVEVSVWKIS